MIVPRRTLLILFGLLLTAGCGPAVSEEELGRIAYEVPDVQGAEEPYPLPPLAPQEKAAESEESGDGLVPDKEEPDAPRAGDSHRVVLEKVGPDAASVIKILRLATGWSTEEAEQRLAHAPLVIPREMSRGDAEGLRAALQDAGATVAIRQGSSVLDEGEEKFTPLEPITSDVPPVPGAE